MESRCPWENSGQWSKTTDTFEKPSGYEDNMSKQGAIGDKTMGSQGFLKGSPLGIVQGPHGRFESDCLRKEI